MWRRSSLAPARAGVWLPGVALRTLLIAFEEVGVLLGAAGALEKRSPKDTAQHGVLGKVLLSSKAERAVAQVATAKCYRMVPLNVPMHPCAHGPDVTGTFCIFLLQLLSSPHS